ncbi:MAG: flagellar export chaperone FliS [Agitococcus sp.]|nr:flagellar export chaperone FliS [Agitococcus sp.]
MVGVNAYQQVSTFTASPWELIDKLYEGAIRSIDEGKVPKALRIVEEGLFGSLNPNVGFSRGMGDTLELVQIHLEQNRAPIARQMLVTLQEGWRGIKDKVVH